MRNARVLILLGSESDYPTMLATVEVFDHFSVPFHLEVASAHRSPARVAELVTSKVADFLVELAAADAAALYVD